jgi:hypothetical protein
MSRCSIFRTILSIPVRQDCGARGHGPAAPRRRTRRVGARREAEPYYSGKMVLCPALGLEAGIFELQRDALASLPVGRAPGFIRPQNG